MPTAPSCPHGGAPPGENRGRGLALSPIFIWVKTALLRLLPCPRPAPRAGAPYAPQHFKQTATTVSSLLSSPCSTYSALESFYLIPLRHRF